MTQPRPSWGDPRIWCVLLVCVLGVGMWTLNAGAQVPNETSAAFQEAIEDCQATVERVSLQGWLSFSLTIGIGICGLVVAVIQAGQGGMWKAFAAVLGTVIGILTFTNDKLFEKTTHRSLFEKYQTGCSILKSARWHLHSKPIPDSASEAYDKYLSVFNDILKPCDALDDDGPPVEWFVRDRQASGLSLQWGTAYAGIVSEARHGPPWLSGKEEDERAVYFIGISHAREHETARADSVDDARNQVREYILSYLIRNGGLAAGDAGIVSGIAERLASGAGVVDSYSTLDSKSDIVSYYTLLSVDRRQLKRLTALGLAGRSGVDAKGISEAVEQAPGPSAAYERRRQKTYACLLDEARAGLSEESYQALLAAREARKAADQGRGSYEEAVRKLTEFLAAHPQQFLAKYNLGLAYERVGDKPNARRAYREAVTLESASKCQDASLYATFGRFAYGTGEFAEAAALLDEALRREPEHEYARRYRELIRESNG